MAEDVAVRVVIEGRVQGVGFRWWIMKGAGAHGLGGWVRNRREGTVEALFHGPETAVRQMIQSCGEGPPIARIRTIREYVDEAPDETGFIDRPTV